MNPLPPNADELVSAYLDGQAAPDEIVIVESSPELMERVDVLRSISDLLGDPTEPPAEQKEAHISAALDAFDAMFSTESAPTVADASTPRLAAVAPIPTEAQPKEQASEVTSLSKAREKRRPRRFNTGVIAAAAAAMLLFVAVAAFGFGGGDSADVATSAADTASTAEMSSDASDDAAMEDDAMEEAMADSAEEAMDDRAAGSALSGLDAAQAPTPAAADSARVESAEVMADEEAMADEEEAMEDDVAMDDQESVEAAAEAEAPAADGDAAANDFFAEDFLFTDLRFPDLESLLDELETLPRQEVEQRALLLSPGLFPGCQSDVAELAEIESPTLVGQTFVADEPVEIHQRIDTEGEIVFVIVDAACMVLPVES